MSNKIEREITLKELSIGNKTWITMNGNVYDVTEYMNKHPGGKDVLLKNNTENKHDEFYLIHSLEAKRKLSNYYIGKLASYKISNETSNYKIEDSGNIVIIYILKGVVFFAIFLYIIIYFF